MRLYIHWLGKKSRGNICWTKKRPKAKPVSSNLNKIKKEFIALFNLITEIKIITLIFKHPSITMVGIDWLFLLSLVQKLQQT